MLCRAVMILIILAFSSWGVAWADDEPTPLIVYPDLPLQAGWTWFGGWVSFSCQWATFYVYSGDPVEGELLGSNYAYLPPKSNGAPTLRLPRNPIGLVLALNRPLREGETTTVYAECGNGEIVQDTFIVEPFVSWPKPLWISPPFYYVPPDLWFTAPPTAGSTAVSGRLSDDACIDRPIYVYSGLGPEDELLGSGIVQSDGSFRVSLKRPVQGENITFYADCTVNVPYGIVVQETFMVPPIVPEPATLLLVGGGMAVLAGYANLRRRTSPGARR